MRYILFFFLVFSSLRVQSQQTVGIFVNEPEAFNGYTIFAPINSYTTYLIDNCGEQVHSWISEYQTGHSVYLLENGLLLRACREGNISDSKGRVQMLDWEGNEIWSHSVMETHGRQHHDIEMLPNGNILLIVWDKTTNAEVVQAGSTSTRDSLFSEKIIEIQPDLENDTAIVVWEWKVWDHLIQDVDSTKDSYGVVADHPERIDINFLSLDTNDPFHANAVDYNAEFDQIVFSPRSFSELWVIDHSTSTEEAAASSGGTYGKGGDLLYRWGNPQVYDQGTEEDRTLYFQHNTSWIDNGLIDGGKIMLFNNRAGNVEDLDYSSVDVINTPVDENGFYEYNGGAYGPTDFDWRYIAPEPTDFYSNIVSGAERLSNGNTIICEGFPGRFLEVDYDGNIVWEYISPINSSGPIDQGVSPSGTITFRCSKYPTNYAGLADRDLTPMGYIEIGSTHTCEIITGTDDLSFEPKIIEIYPNPVNDILNLQVGSSISRELINSISMYNSNGAIVYATDKFHSTIDVSAFDAGIYFIQFNLKGNHVTKKIVIE